MVTADDEQTTDIITSGDVEETTRFCRVRHPAESAAQVVRGHRPTCASTFNTWVDPDHWPNSSHLCVPQELSLQEKGKEYVKGILER